MGQHLILEFPTQASAEQGLYIINLIAAAYWQSQGYTVIDGQLIGKNAATGEDMPESARTLTWDVPKLSPDKTWCITSPASSENFKDWRSYLPEGVSFPDDTIMPIEWTQRTE